MSVEVISEQGSQSAALARQLRHMILDGKISAQEPLPSHRHLADRFNVGVQVVRSALAILEDEGLVYSRERRGVFIRVERGGQASRASEAPLQCINFVERSSGTAPGFVRTDYLQGYTDALEHLDVKMRILSCPDRDHGWEALFSPHFTFQDQGFVLINLVSEPLMRWLAERHVPFVVQNNRAYATSEFPPHHCVYINKVHAGFQAVRHLIGLGHQRIGFIGAAPQGDTQDYDVYDGYKSAIVCSGSHVRLDDVLNFSTNELAMAVGPVRAFIDRADRPTAFVAQNDATALAVLEAAKQLNLRIPADLSVVGFDDLPQSESSDPPLTTVASPRAALGRAAVEMLLRASAGELEAPQARVLEGQLIARGTTAPPRDRA